MNRTFWPMALLVLCAGGYSRAQEAAAEASRPVASHALTEHEVVVLALQNNPSYRSTLLALEQARHRVDGERGAFPWVFQADGGYTHSEAPGLGPQRSVVTSTSDSVSVGSQLEKSFPAGTGLRFRVQGDHYETRRPTTSLATGESTTSRGVGYEMSARATLTQPLLKGRGQQVNLAGLRTARISRTQAERASELTASELVRDVRLRYWELWYADRAVGIEREALELARRQHEEAVARAAQGALAPVDVFTFETRLAELRESVVSAEAGVVVARLELEQLLGGGSVTEIQATPPAGVTLPSEAVVVKLLEVSSPDVAELEERVRLAQANAEQATEPYRAQLDLESYVEARGLGNGRPAPAAEQLGRLDAVSAYAGLLYRTPLDRRQRDSAQATADLEVSIARSNLTSARQRLRVSAVSLVASARAAQASLGAARKTEEIAARQFEAERLRFAAGATTPIQVQVAEDSLRQARHRVERATLDLVEARIQLDHYTGELLREYRAELPAP